MPSSDTEAGAEGDEEQVVAAVDPHHAIGDGSAWLLMANHTAMATLAPPTPRGGWQLRGASSPGRKICVFDLDNTLVVARYGLFDSPPRDDELDLPGSPLPYPQQGTSPMRVQARPGAIELLKLMHATCDVVLWTASERKVALPKVEWLEDRVGHLFAATLYRSATTPINGMYIKDLRVFVSPPGDVERRTQRKRRKRRHHEPHNSRTLADIVLVEDCVFAGAGQPDNVVPISHWTGDRSDTALSALGSLLTCVLSPDVTDVRPLLRSLFDLSGRMKQVERGQGCAALRGSANGSGKIPPSSCAAVCTCRFLLEHRILVGARGRLQRKQKLLQVPAAMDQIHKRPRNGA